VKQLVQVKRIIILWIATLATVLYSCNERSDLGMELLPTDDLISVKNLVEQSSISSYTFREDSIRTDEASSSLLGILDDPVFGRTTVNFAVQPRLQSFPDFGENPTPDSVKFFLYYRLIYGDTVTPQTFKIYELESSIDRDDDYYQDEDLKLLASDELLGQVEYTPRVRLDSATADTFYQLITIPLDISLAEKLVNADSLQMIDNDVFLQYFKGLYVESEKESDTGGTILSLAASSTDNFQGSALAVYYNNDENRAAEEPDTLLMPYVISPFSARVNSITHDYTGTPFFENLNQTSDQDSLIYVQSTGGLKSRILIEDLSAWKDSVNIGINKAELVFQIDTIASEVDKFPPPAQLLFTVVNENGEEFLPIDYLFSPAFYGGSLNEEDYTYRFNITQHMQQIIDGDAENYGFFLTTARKNSEANRVVLKGSNSQTGIKLIVTYSKFLQ